MTPQFLVLQESNIMLCLTVFLENQLTVTRLALLDSYDSDFPLKDSFAEFLTLEPTSVGSRKSFNKVLPSKILPLRISPSHKSVGIKGES